MLSGLRKAPSVTRRGLILAGSLSAMAFSQPSWTFGRQPMPYKWRAKWLVAEQSGAGAVMLRREFTVRGKIASARLYVASQGGSETYINAHKVGDDVLSPGRPVKGIIPYRMYDVTEWVVAGGNGLGGFVGRGWLGDPKQPLCYLVQLEITYSDGSTDFIMTDESWMISDSPITRSDIHSGETWDARRQQGGWAKTGFKPPETARWSPVTLALTPPGRLKSVEPPLRRLRTFGPVSVQATQFGYRLDFGELVNGWVKMKVQGEPGDTYQIRFGEVVPGALEAEDMYIVKGGGTPETYEPHFTLHRFQYVEVTGFKGAPAPDSLFAVDIG